MIRIFNDHKEKYQSWEASIDVSTMEAFFHGSVQLTGYGADENEAKMNLLKGVSKLEGLMGIDLISPGEYVDVSGKQISK